jgi:hypothetical protein
MTLIVIDESLKLEGTVHKSSWKTVAIRAKTIQELPSKAQVGDLLKVCGAFWHRRVLKLDIPRFGDWNLFHNDTSTQSDQFEHPEFEVSEFG